MERTKQALTDEQFRVLLDLFMCSDPFPLPDTQRIVLVRLLDSESAARGYEGGWVVAYHEFELPKPEPAEPAATRPVSPYTREEFVDREYEFGIEVMEPHVYAEGLTNEMAGRIRKRAEWNAQAAERAGIIWRK